MIAVAMDFGDRRGRVFFNDQVIPSPQTLAERFGKRYFDEDDRTRDQHLRELLQQPIIEGTAHPGVDASDVIHVYLKAADGAPLFACNIVSEERLAIMLQEAPAVFENFNLQVASGPNITDSSLRAAIETWASRNYADLSPAQFRLLPWLDEESSDGLEVVLQPGAITQAQPDVAGPTDLPRRYRPDPGVLHPALPPDRQAA